MEKSYRVVTIMEDDQLMDMALFVDSDDKAERYFKDKIKEHLPAISEEELQDAADEGMYQTPGDTFLMLAEPHNIFGKE